MKKLTATFSILSILSILSVSAVPAFAQSNIRIVGSGHANQHIDINNSVHNVINNNINFTDIKGSWAEKAILDLVKKGVLHGVDKRHFRPDDQITREQFATMVTKYFQLQNSASTQDFADVPTNKWSYASIEAAKDYMDAYRTLGGDLDFKPGLGIKREDVTVTLVKVLLKSNTNLTLLDAASADQLLASKFKDANQIAPALRPYVATAVQAGIIHGDKGKFAPNRVLTRAEVAALLEAINNLNLEVVVPSDNPTAVTPTTSSTSANTSSTEVPPTTSSTTGDTGTSAVVPTTSSTSENTGSTEVPPTTSSATGDTSTSAVPPTTTAN